MRLGWVPAVLAAAAFAGVAVVFARETVAFRAAVLAWAGNDLDSRTRIAVETLREPLRGGDFAAVHRFNDECAVDNVRLSVFGKPRGLVFDSLGGAAETALRDQEFLFGPSLDAGVFTVRLALPLDHVLAPFRRARLSFLLAALLGMAGVSLFFVVIWRQRMRLREMARLERFRSEFVADVSHEIKTPLTGILGAVEMLGDERNVLLGMIRKESKRLNALVQSILDLARLEHEGDVLNWVGSDLVAVVDEAVRECRPAAEAAGVAIRWPDPAPGSGVAVRIDPQLVSQAVSNLIVNAVRHSGAQEVRVAVESAARAACVTVSDTGIGIPPEHAASVFERFHRVDPARAAETGGAGLGLAIVRRIARLHGGDVTYRPAEPRGSVFTLTLPRHGSV